MKFSSPVFLGLVAVAAALPQDSSTITSAPSSSVSLSPQASCISSCPVENVTCKASCLGVPAPNSSMVEETTGCAAKCPQGNGSPEDTSSYAACQQACISSSFFTGATGAAGAGSTPTPSPGGSTASTTGAAAGSTAGSSESGSGSSPSETGSDSSGSSASGSSSSDGSSSASDSSTGASSSSTGNAAAHVQAGASAAGIFGIVLAAFAL
ncbi:MAG: hypothetical protein Q9160_002821 [Pyrenula sp. 1 TL-2023]